MYGMCGGDVFEQRQGSDGIDVVYEMRGGQILGGREIRMFILRSRYVCGSGFCAMSELSCRDVSERRREDRM